MTVYGIKARYYTRQAWLAMGKAREAKFNYVNGMGKDKYWDREMVAHHVRIARMTMGTAIIYRQIDGRL